MPVAKGVGKIPKCQPEKLKYQTVGRLIAIEFCLLQIGTIFCKKHPLSESARCLES